MVEEDLERYLTEILQFLLEELPVTVTVGVVGVELHLPNGNGYDFESTSGTGNNYTTNQLGERWIWWWNYWSCTS